MLNPNDRKIYLDEVSPPPGYRLDCAVATTFSLDLLTLLMAPLSMALYQYRDKNEMLNSPEALLEALHQTAGRFAVFCQNGRISVPAKDTLLYSYLEKAVIGVNPPNPKGVFHPKTWLLRFEAEKENLPVFYRFLCLSRNLTFDRSWDTVLSLEGKLEEKRKLGYSRNRPLTEFINILPELAVNPPNPEILKIIKRMKKEVPRVRFTTPEGFDPHFRFFPIGMPGHLRFPKVDKRNRTLVLSPFVSFAVLKQLTEQGRNNIVISRLQELADLTKNAYNFLQKSSRLFFMDSGAERPEQTHLEEEAEHVGGELGDFSGLHAKLIITENASQASVWTGSANATNHAFRGQNVEFMVKLSGPRNKVGINKFLGGESDRLSFMSMLRPYEREPGQPAADRTLKKLEKMLENARSAIADADLKVNVTREAGDEYGLSLVPSKKGLELPPGVAGVCYPITLPDSHAQDIQSLIGGEPIAFKDITLESLTGFIAFRLSAHLKGRKQQTSFVLNLPVSGQPKERDQRILHRLLADKDGFMRYLLFILSGDQRLPPPPGSGHDRRTNRGRTGWAFDLPLFEEMVRAFSRAPEKIDRIERLINNIKEMEQYEQILPEGFDEIWQAFATARNMEETH